MTFHFFEPPFFYLDIVDLQYLKLPGTVVSTTRLNLNLNRILEKTKVKVQLIPQLLDDHWNYSHQQNHSLLVTLN